MRDGPLTPKPYILTTNQTRYSGGWTSCSQILCSNHKTKQGIVGDGHVAPKPYILTTNQTRYSGGWTPCSQILCSNHKTKRGIVRDGHVRICHILVEEHKHRHVLHILPRSLDRVAPINTNKTPEINKTEVITVISVVVSSCQCQWMMCVSSSLPHIHCGIKPVALITLYIYMLHLLACHHFALHY